MSKLSQKSITTWKKPLFMMYAMQDSKPSISTTIQTAIQLLFLLTEHLNYVSIIVLSGYSIQFYKSSTYLPQLLSIFRIDLVFQVYFSQPTIFYAFLSVLSVNFLFKTAIFFQLLIKKKFCLSIFSSASKVSSAIIINLLKIPILSLGINNGNPLNNENSSQSYKEELTTQYQQVLLNLILSCMLVSLVFLDLLLGNFPKWSTKGFSCNCSHLQIKEFFGLIFLMTFRLLLNTQVFFFTALLISLYFAYSYTHYIPYYNTHLNTAHLHNWLTLATTSFLLIAAEISQNFYIVELSLPCLYVVSLLLCHEIVQNRIRRLKSGEVAKDSFIAELQIRFLVFSGEWNKDKIFEHYADVTRRFFEFDLQYIWESMALHKFVKDDGLALLKLAKVKMCKVNQVQSKSFKPFLRLQSYFFQLEVEYYTFRLFNKIVRKFPEATLDTSLIKYFNNLHNFSQLESEILQSLLTFSISLSQDSSLPHISSSISKIGSQIRIFKSFYTKMCKKYSHDQEFKKIFKSFCSDILKKEENLFGKYEEINTVLSKRLTGRISTIELSGSILIVSGRSQNIGEILYANRKACTLLKATESELVGTSFISIIPPPFDAIHKDVLMKFIMFRNYSELQRSHFCVLDSLQHCVEVNMKLKLSFNEGSAYFIVSFFKIIPEKNLILADKEGIVCGVSKNIKQFFPVLHESIFLLLPGLRSYIQANNQREIFEYSNGDKKFLLKYNQLRIDSYELMIFYIGEVWRRESFVVESQEDSEMAVGPEVSKIALEEEKDNERSDWDLHLRLIKMLGVFVKVSVLLEILLFLAISFIVVDICKQLDVNSVVFDVGLMRYLSISAAANVQALVMMQANVSLPFSEEFYRNKTLNDAQQLIGLLKKYDEIELPMSNTKVFYFRDTYLEVFYERSNETVAKKVALFDAISVVGQYCLLVAGTEFGAFENVEDEVRFLYRNLPAEYFGVLNQTVSRVVEDIDEHVNNIFSYLKYCELFSITLPALLLGISTTYLILLESANKRLWSHINTICTSDLESNFIQIKKRLSLAHKKSSTLHLPEVNNKNTYYKSIIYKPILKLFVFLLISIGFYFTIVYSEQNYLIEILQSSLKHTNFGGLRRAMTPLSLFWCRNAYFELNYQKSYKDYVIESPVGSSVEELYSVLTIFLAIQKSIMNQFSLSPLRNYDFGDYYQMMFGNACEYINGVNNCSNSPVCVGLDSALKGYINEITYLLSVHDQNPAPSSLNYVEQYSKVIEQSFVSGLYVFTNTTATITSKITTNLSVTTYLTCLIIIFFYIFMALKISLSISEDFQDKIHISTIFSVHHNNKPN